MTITEFVITTVFVLAVTGSSRKSMAAPMTGISDGVLGGVLWKALVPADDI